MEDKLLYADGLEEAIIGVGSRCGQDDVVCYDAEKVIQIFVSQGMSYEEAQEYAECNVFGAWVGDKTPMWITLYPEWITLYEENGEPECQE